MGCLKKDAPQELLEALRRIEERADGCFGSLALLRVHSNVAVWAVLGGGINMVEHEIEQRTGDYTADLTAALLNVSRLARLALRWANKHGKPPSPLAALRWTPSLATKVGEALNVAHSYGGFETCFPMWHKNRYLADLLSPTLVRFTAPGTARDRQVSAFQKGFRPTQGSFKRERPQKDDQTPRVRALFAEAVGTARKKGMMRFQYDHWALWLELLPEYRARVTSIVRRPDALSLGDYTLGDFNQFYAAFLAVCAAHEHICFLWKVNRGVYPFDSAVMVRLKQHWRDILSQLSGISADKCQRIIGDLSFDFSRSVDLHIHPFVPLDSVGFRLAVAFPFPLQSRPDENILRVCSMLRPDVFDITSVGKEPEILMDLKKRCPSRALQGPLAMPKPLPDIDLIVSDEGCSTVIVAELKWIRKTVRPIEKIDSGCRGTQRHKTTHSDSEFSHGKS
jgi:hypothetical protein